MKEGQNPMDEKAIRTFCSVSFTDECNLACPWCIRGEGLKARKPLPLWTDEVREAFFRHVAEQPYRSYGIFGGESLLYPEETLAVIRRIRSLAGSEAGITVYTNGTQLTPALAKALNELGAGVVLSVNFQGYKGLDTFFSHARDAEHLMRAVLSLRRLSLRVVTLRGRPFAAECAALHALFRCDVCWSPDYLTLADWDEGDFSRLDAELTLLDRLAPEHGWFSPNLCGRSFCDCRERSRSFRPDGVWAASAFSSENAIYGCAAARDAFGEKNYNRFVVTALNHDRRTDPRRNFHGTC